MLRRWQDHYRATDNSHDRRNVGRRPNRTNRNSGVYAAAKTREKLEDILLEAAWCELVEKGYSSLTMEAIASRAETSQPALYRRWSSIEEVGIAAIRHYFSRHPLEVEDLGDLRSEMISPLRQSASRGAAAPSMMQ